ncbi:MAG: HAMP domain-containing histidine kinase [Butyricicoccus pullicaecorum]|nr:HAMP domain-containing histidine kinase [Butyricicoccus pullicaecorum]
MKPRKWCAAWVKILFSVIALSSMTAASVTGAFVLLYGVEMRGLNGRPFAESAVAESLTRKGAGYRTQMEVAPEIQNDEGSIQSYITANNQTMVDIYTYYRYLNTPIQNGTRSQTPEYYQMLYQNTNIRARVILVDAQGNYVMTMCNLGEPWDENTILVDRMTSVHLQNSAWIEIGFDRTFAVPDDPLARQARVYQMFVQNRTLFLIVLAVSTVLFVLSVLFLLLAAGHRKADTEIHLRFFDHWGFALLAIPLFTAIAICLSLVSEQFYSYQMFIDPSYSPQMTWSIQTGCFLIAAMLWLSAGLFVFGLRTVVVRVKAHRFWSTTLCYYVLNPLWEWVTKRRSRTPQETQPLVTEKAEGLAGVNTGFSVDGEKIQATVQDFAHKTQDTVQELAQKTQGAMHKAVQKAKAFEWNGSRLQRLLSKIRDELCRVGAALCKVLSRLDIMGLGMVLGSCVVFVYLFSNVFYWLEDRLLFMTVFSALVLAGLFWILRQVVRLQEGIKRLAEGDLTYKMDTKHLHGPFRIYAHDLNRISAGMTVEVERRMKSEHLKTELLTNVSHDIKTPLTSIINYVDLLKNQDIASEDAKSYVEVLDRQSHRLKKLLEDLIEASKAATGNITAELAPTDAAELLRQAEGEYNERLREQKLIPVLRIDAETCSILADGRLLWRVFDNLLGNIVKYAMPGTRVYLELSHRSDRCVITIRNISKDELGIEAEELMERFVRGDAARATEGSGLGLSIARSLTECMKGGFDLVLDGDLFKVILDFPLVSANQ